MLDRDEPMEEGRETDRLANDDYPVLEAADRGPAATSRPNVPELEGGRPLPEELTGRASRTSDDLTALFGNDSPEHLADGVRGGSGDDPELLDREAGLGPDRPSTED